MNESEPGFPEFNPLRYPPCACTRCRRSPEGAEGDAGSAALQRLRERVNEENAMRRSVRRPS